MLRFKFGAWAVVLMLAALSFGACSDEDDDPAFNVADCWVADDELEVWFDGNANWLMTENELESIDSLVPAVYTAFNNTKYSSWVVTDVYVLVYPQNPTESVIQVKQGSRRYSLVFSQDGGLLHEKDISNGDDTIWPPAE